MRTSLYPPELASPWIPGSDVTVRSGGRAAIFDLAGGSLKADVAKLAPDERFVVETADTEVEVRGTSFRVSVVPLDATCGDGTTTRVAVYEGMVAVRRNGREEIVSKGEEWPDGGGDPHVALLQALQATGDFGPVSLIDVDELPGDALIMPCGGIGAPTVSIEKIENGDEGNRLRDHLET